MLMEMETAESSGAPPQSNCVVQNELDDCADPGEDDDLPVDGELRQEDIELIRLCREVEEIFLRLGFDVSDGKRPPEPNEKR